jgi:hypothetical protein
LRPSNIGFSHGRDERSSTNRELLSLETITAPHSITDGSSRGKTSPRVSTRPIVSKTLVVSACSKILDIGNSGCCKCDVAEIAQPIQAILN